jgi:hypothetical protein
MDFSHGCAAAPCGWYLKADRTNDLLRHFESAESLSVIIIRRRFQSRCDEQVDSCHDKPTDLKHELCCRIDQVHVGEIS